MSDRSDWLRSLVKKAADRVEARVREQPAVAAVRSLARDLRSRSAGIPERALARAALRMPGVASSSLNISDGALLFEAELESGRWSRARILPESPRFAGRGAKELVFRIEPAEAAGDSAVRELVGVVSALVARTVWNAAVKPAAGEVSEGAFVEREGDILFVDLRTVPSVRAALATSAGAAITEAIRVERLECRDGALFAVIGLPAMP